MRAVRLPQDQTSVNNTLNDQSVGSKEKLQLLFALALV